MSLADDVYDALEGEMTARQVRESMGIGPDGHLADKIYPALRTLERRGYIVMVRKERPMGYGRAVHIWRRAR